MDVNVTSRTGRLTPVPTEYEADGAQNFGIPELTGI